MTYSTIHFGLVLKESIADMANLVLMRLPDNVDTYGDSFLDWTKSPAPGAYPLILHLHASGYWHNIDVNVNWYRQMLTEKLGSQVRLADYAFVTDGLDWTKDRRIYLFDSPGMEIK